MTTTVSTTNISHDSYYAANKNNEPRQKLFAVLRYEKQNSNDQPGWIIKIITQDQRDLIDTLNESISFPNTDGEGYVSNIEDNMLVEIIPTDVFVKKI